MRLLIVLFLLLALVGCAAQPGSAAITPLPQPTIPAVAEGIDRPPKGTLEVIGYLYRTNAGAALVGGLSFSHGSEPVPLPDAGALWLPDSLSLPADAPSEEAAGISYMVVRAAGTLSPEGRYGPGGIYPYQLSKATLEPLGLRDLSIPLLLANTGIYDNQPIRLSGQLLLSSSTVLLVDQIGKGGVPEPSAYQIKLLGMAADPALLQHLTPTSTGGVHFGPVQVVGIWRRSALYLLAIIPA